MVKAMRSIIVNVQMLGNILGKLNSAIGLNPFFDFILAIELFGGSEFGFFSVLGSFSFRPCALYSMQIS